MHMKAARQMCHKNGTLKRFDVSKSPAGLIRKHTKDTDIKTDQEPATRTSYPKITSGILTSSTKNLNKLGTSVICNYVITLLKMWK